MSDIGFTIKGDKNQFLDRKPIIEALGKSQGKALARDGGLVRTIAVRSLRNAPKGKLKKLHDARVKYGHARGPLAKKRALLDLLKAQREASAAPGQPPKNVKGQLKQHLFFQYDAASRSVVIGPEKLGAGVAPAALEYGGPSVTKTRRRNTTTVRRVSIRPHPYMGPALAKARPKLVREWADIVH